MAIELSAEQNHRTAWQTLQLFLKQQVMLHRVVIPAIIVWVIIVIIGAIRMSNSGGQIILSIIIFGGMGSIGITLLAARWWHGQFTRIMDFPRVYVADDFLRRNDDLQVRYKQRFKQKTEITTLKVQLVLREWVRYTQGTSTHTDQRDIVIDEDWLDHEPIRPEQIYEHDFDLRVPSNAMHSFEASNNKITWHLVIDLDLPGWIDYKNSYALTVTPEVYDDALV